MSWNKVRLSIIPFQHDVRGDIVSVENVPREMADIYVRASLAYMELRCCIAYFFSHFDFVLAGGDTGKKMEWIDRFVAANVRDVQVKVLKDRWT